MEYQESIKRLCKGRYTANTAMKDQRKDMDRTLAELGEKDRELEKLRTRVDYMEKFKQGDLESGEPAAKRKRTRPRKNPVA